MTDPSSSQRNLVEELAEDFLARHRRGERPSIAEYAERHPALADEIQEVFAALELMEGVRPGNERDSPSTAPHPQRDGKRMDRVGDYRILREVGRGGMGIVYEAEQISLGRHVAVKVLPATALLDGRHLQRFQREARAAARLHHTNIVPVFDVGAEDNVHYYVMQFIPGLGLDKVLEELRSAEKSTGDGTRPPDSSSIHLPGQSEDVPSSHHGPDYWRSVARIGLQVADALSYAAAQGVLHRDIKPSNLLLDARGTVWVTDFGLAKTTEQDDHLTHSGDVLGTLRYMAPERFHGQADIRSDIYGLGLTLYELCAKQAAFVGKQRHEIIRRIAEEDPVSLEKLCPGIPRDLVTVIQKTITKRPAERYQSAGELADDLRRFLDDRPIAARRTGRLEQMWRWCRRNRRLAAVILVACLLALTAGSLAILARQRRQVAETAEAKRVTAELVQAEKSRVAEDARLVADFLARDVIFPGSTPHGHSPWTPQLEALQQAEAKIPQIFQGHPLAEATLRHRLGKSYFRIGELPSAAIHLRIAYDLRKNNNGPEHHETLESMDFLALALRDQGDLLQARKLREEMLAIATRERGSRHGDTLACIRSLMEILRDQGELDKSRALAEEVLSQQRQEYGPEDPRTLDSSESLVLILRAQGQLQQAKELCESIIALRTRVAGSEDRRTLRSRSLYAILLKDLALLTDALGLGEKTLTAQRRLLGEEHSETLLTTCTVSYLLTKLGRFPEAHALCERTLDTGHCFLVNEHPDSRDPDLLKVVDACIDAFEEQKKLDKAGILAREVLSVCIRAFGWDHERTTTAFNKAIRLLELQGKQAEVTSLRRGAQLAKSLRR